MSDPAAELVLELLSDSSHTAVPQMVYIVNFSSGTVVEHYYIPRGADYIGGGKVPLMRRRLRQSALLKNCGKFFIELISADLRKVIFPCSLEKKSIEIFLCRFRCNMLLGTKDFEYLVDRVHPGGERIFRQGQMDRLIVESLA